MRVALGSDHRGFELKSSIIKYLASNGHTALDMGCYSTDSADYPDFAAAVAESVASGEAARGILVCGSGIGMSITANKYKGVRAALCCKAELARRARLHNDANVLCLGSDFIDPQEALKAVDDFIVTEFEGGRHQRRLDTITKIEAAQLDNK
jgi:RpiB/LacA/LacB family sugar-phosphate isomerase